MPAYYRATLGTFARTDPRTVLGRLAEEYAREGFATQFTAATEAWQWQIQVLQESACGLIDQLAEVSAWSILLEYPIPRRSRRIDAVLLAADLVFAIEFKTGSHALTAADVRQVEDYCLDLRDFHAASAGRTVIPLLVAPRLSGTFTPPGPLEGEAVQRVHVVRGTGVVEAVVGCYRTWHRAHDAPIDPEAWDLSPYRPTPTIIEAAQRLYANHRVEEITHAHAGAVNLTRTAQAVLRVIATAKASGRKAICFITGVPGAGKTLAGLNIVHNRDLHHDREALGVFLSGNGPLVKVLTEALARDRHRRLGEVLATARRTVTTFLQNVHGFLGEYAGAASQTPPDHVVVFDEAQRAWDAEHSFRKFRRSESEPSLMLQVMDRRKDWAVIVALVGNGQEINTGEAGLQEWGRALASQFPHWEAHISPRLVGDSATPGGRPLFREGSRTVAIVPDPDLHLSVCIRSYRAEALASWVDEVLAGRPDGALRFRSRMDNYPMMLTRSLEMARRWLLRRARGLRRAGLVASSGARRLRAHGIDVTALIDEPNWFLQPHEDVRSSCFLEVAATEFAVQGLELDWTGVCWGADFRWDNGWLYRRFSGTHWQQVNNEVKRRYLLNKYRVLLTRAREGMVIWVPSGSVEDPTRRAGFYDGTADYLRSCGAEPLEPG
jgi:hypothetical protein